MASETVFLLLPLAVLSACSERKTGSEICTVTQSIIPPPKSVEELLQMSNIFLAARITDNKTTEYNSLAEEFGWKLLPENCKFPYRRARLVETGQQVYAAETLQGSLEDIVIVDEWCGEQVSQQWICDGGPPPRDGSLEDYCTQQDVTINTCGVPEWHFRIPGNSERTWFMFLWKDPENERMKKVASLSMVFAGENGLIELGILENGQDVPLADMESYLLRNTIEGVPRFLP